MCSSGSVFDFNNLVGANLLVDAIYKGGTAGHVGDDPLALLLGVGNQGGFRSRLADSGDTYSHVVLYSSLLDLDWPDRLDIESGTFVYFGDNKFPGHSLEDTPRGGNKLLRLVFDNLHSACRHKVPPFFVFTKGYEGRDVIFRGLAAPGAPNVPPTEDLVAIWRSRDGERFQNYRATFTILNAGEIPRHWISDLVEGNPLSANCPPAWWEWVETGKYIPLRAVPQKRIRTRDEQLPQSEDDWKTLLSIYQHFAEAKNWHGFERFAAEIVQLMDRNVVEVEVTRPSRDGGRDAVGRYQIGLPANAVLVEFALEAKCYDPERNSVGVKETSRLISRLRHRQFGIFVTTSYVAQQAYQEIVEDGHPVVIVSGGDIVKILRDSGIANLETWLAEA